MLDELEIGEALEAKTPASEGYTGSGRVRDALNNLWFNSATATADAADGQTAEAAETEQAEATAPPTTCTPEQGPAPTSAQADTETPQIAQTISPAPASGNQAGALSGEGWPWIAGSAVVIGLGLIIWQEWKKNK